MANEYTENLKKGKRTQFKSGADASEKGRKGGKKSQEVQKSYRNRIHTIQKEFWRPQHIGKFTLYYDYGPKAGAGGP